MKDPGRNLRRLRPLLLLLLLGLALTSGAFAEDPPPARPSLAPT